MSLVSFTPVTDGSTATAAGVNTPLSTIYNDYNGNITDANVATGAAIAGSKIAVASLGFSATVQTAANAGTWGGTNFYISLGGIKICWGLSAVGSALATGNNTGFLSVTLPTSFFSTVQNVQASVSDSGGSFENWLHCTVGAISASSVGIKVTNTGSGTSGTGYKVYWYVIGT